jgi:Protein of unknown function (DUF1214)
VANSLTQFAICNCIPVKYDSDGFLDRYFQNASPGADKEANWLPAQTGAFNLTMCLSAPKSDALNRESKPAPDDEAIPTDPAVDAIGLVSHTPRSTLWEAILATETKATLHQRALQELKEFAILTVYLYVTLGAVVIMKTSVLHTEGIEFAPWGIAIVKALLLAKFILLGNAMRIGERYPTSPLIWPTLHKAFAFLLLLVILTIIEEAVVGLFHHQSIAASLSDLVGRRLEETLAGFLILLLVLIPFFAFRVLGEALGEGRLERMFFVEREPVKQR